MNAPTHFLTDNLRSLVEAAVPLPPANALALLAEPNAFEAMLQSGHAGADQKAIDTALALAWAAAAWRTTGDESYRLLLKRWQPVLETHPPMRVPRFAFENRDLIVGHLLLSFALMDDLLRESFELEFEQAVRNALRGQARQAYDDFTDPTAFPSFAYEQNHLIIPICALGIAAMALDSEEQQANRWGAFAREFLEHSFDAIAKDGWFFEGVDYWNFTMQFPICYAVALKRATGENLFLRPPFKDAVHYLAHNVLPDPKFVFDFSDWGPRVEPDGIGFQPGYDQPWHALPTYLSRSLLMLLAPEQGGEPWRDLLKCLPSSPTPTILDATLQLLMEQEAAQELPRQAAPLPTSHYFEDMEVLHWRGGWNVPAATALAFKSGPPAGHHLATLLPQYPEWRLELGHAHPDAGSFQLFAHGVFLANDTGYTGKKETSDHNSILVDGIGQHRGGTPWSTFAAKPYCEYDKIRMENVWHTPRVAAATAVFDAAYDAALKLTAMRRSLILVDGRFLLVCDTLRSSLEHEYEWRLHGDQPARASGRARFVMENGPGRLVIVSLGADVSHRVAPTVVETECFSETRSRPQQRGFHLALTSSRTRDFRFLIAMGIQSSSIPETAFAVRLEPDGRLEFSDDQGGCTVWLGACGCRDFDGIYAYHLRDAKGKTLSAGMLGRSLTSPGLMLRSPDGGIASVNHHA